MKFGETFTEYLQGEQGLGNCSHVEYKRLKKVLKRCRACQASVPSPDDDGHPPNPSSDDLSHHDPCSCQTCTLCDEKFFTELMKEASDIAWCFNSRVRRLLHLHVAKGMQKYVVRVRQCFKDDRQEMVEQGRMLIEYITMNAIAIRKILKKYDKVHSSENGKNFRLKMRAEHMELLQSPWLIELGAFCLNFSGLGGEGGELAGYFSLDMPDDQPVMTLTIPSCVKLEYNLTCAICLDTLFNPYALSCGHLFCKMCACSAASVMGFQALKSADPDVKCPVCREAGVYANSVHMLELNLLLKRRCKDYWKERIVAERAELVKQSKEYWDSQAQLAVGI